MSKIHQCSSLVTLLSIESSFDCHWTTSTVNSSVSCAAPVGQSWIALVLLCGAQVEGIKETHLHTMAVLPKVEFKKPNDFLRLSQTTKNNSVLSEGAHCHNVEFEHLRNASWLLLPPLFPFLKLSLSTCQTVPLFVDACTSSDPNRNYNAVHGCHSCLSLPPIHCCPYISMNSNDNIMDLMIFTQNLYSAMIT